ncbi:MAG: hypothetical protein COX02_01980 [Candidatus Vogelbacteria bacterium CG22_combo_CG10-13_8_21_14_all_37_9]|uniref:Glycerol-3-phosphate dehydrogenase n=1 Tax=Candidatus Vogelbacteria bacterium CG22_combo_CG10-13_8_21_14_all_37_9 TaxID=1975046 RepID=A0A2H0BKD1_9BACT|nr:MAG: hypothetical protein COX02_01980 [Candidatus Vogelbacteria bacterium CG22_combo_CG10-13_8_21_14_all_37_9]
MTQLTSLYIGPPYVKMKLFYNSRYKCGIIWPMTKVAIIGAGEMGRTLGSLIIQKGHSVYFWDKFADQLIGLNQDSDQSLPAIIDSAEVIFLCVPSSALREVLFFIEPYLKAKQVLVSLIKGLEASQGLTATQFISKIVPRCYLGVLGGPMLAEELKANLPGGAVLASKRAKVLDLVAPLLSNPKLRVETSSDLAGVSIAGVLKNIYVLGLGAGEALKWGANARALYLTEALQEMIKIGHFFGAKTETFFGLAGLGDLLATGFSLDSFNFQVGQSLVNGKDLSQISEGQASLPILLDLLGPRAKKFPLLLLLKKLVLDKAEAKILYTQAGYL